MIVPPAAGAVPPEPLQLYPDLDFVAVGLGIPEVTPEGFDQVIHRLGALAAELKESKRCLSGTLSAPARTAR
ncbi:aspartate racemase/maleate isomerase family protein [Pseudodonghicola flavimaris]|uniref:Uncharacterized protein n=1 Tax=Pseudodonghicola flavimaris TaxID=3050036 RepID=A0ABT7F7X6_9RHOB|nr:hypothetical protein [Pseudodonghicola flavimaris]MDK3020688.1 hypothetical protein [Pseudodonghicola flavimaris]